MTERNDFDIYSNFNDKIPLRKKNLRQSDEEYGSEDNFTKSNNKNKESFSDWVDKMTKKLEK
ncbi:hypothetical protein ACOQFO_06415 [Ureibacillus sp. MALMAid1270]|uniref:hypothetical protein n=1 Tax=Ureibacillus sp. MALMAid1270 TaxID=3411629 RepID=UPI003BA64B58